MSALTLVILAAGVGSRFGGPKQLSPVGPSGETLLDYAIYDAVRAGFAPVVLVVRKEVAAALEAHVSDVTGGAIPVQYAEQRVSEGRAKPWGTGHAVLAAREAVGVTPFAVCNADDYYGPGAYRLLAEHLTGKGSRGIHALVGYRLDETLSEHGGVARAVASLGPDGLVARVVEVRDVRREAGWLRGVTATGEPREFTGAEPCSMNLWGFAPDVFAVLDDQFAAFRSGAGRAPDAEFLLSTALDAQVVSGRARLRVVTARDRWLGMTFAPEVPLVRAAIGELVRAGTYPPDLRVAFSHL